jgi:hypothetical protein
MRILHDIHYEGAGLTSKIGRLVTKNRLAP